jgi:hypothetical protein
MLRRLLIASVIAVTAAATLPSDASARGRGGGWHGGGGGGHWHGGGGRWHGGGWGGRGFYGPAFGLGIGLAAPYYAYGGYGGYGCWRTVRVGTPYGWRLRRVWVCG